MDINYSRYIDRRSKTPPAIQLLQSFRTDISEGRYPVGSVLPTAAELAEMTGIPVEDCELTYTMLMRAKLAEMRDGRFVSVAQPVPPVIFEKIGDFRAIVESMNMVYDVIDEPIEHVKFDPGVHPPGFEGRDLISLRRRHYGERRCYILVESLYSAEDMPAMADKTPEDTRRYYEFFKHPDIPGFRSVSTLSNILLPYCVAEIMGQMKGTSCSAVENDIYSNDRLIVHSNIWLTATGLRFQFKNSLIFD